MMLKVIDIIVDVASSFVELPRSDVGDVFDDNIAIVETVVEESNQSFSVGGMFIHIVMLNYI